MPIKNKVQLITYPDSLGGGLSALNNILRTYFPDVFEGGVHILPPFPSSGDRGFAPLTYFEIEPAFGTWNDIRRIGEKFDVLVDVMVNHISRQSAYFQDFVENGRSAEWADLFITLDKIWPDGNPPTEDVSKIFLRKPEHPFSDIKIKSTGETERIWTSFGPRVDWSEQIDLDVHSETTRALLLDWFRHMSEQGVSIIRLDAVGYCIKKAGTSCFFIEPDIYQFLDWIIEEADKLNLDLLPEVHAHYSIQFKLAENGYWVYDFVLPALVLHTLFTRDHTKLADYLRVSPRKAFTNLDTHDGIPIQPDVDDILTVAEAQNVVNICMDRGANLNRILGKDHLKVAGFDAHQINCTYYDAVGRDDDAYMAARAIQLFAPGVPQIYYVGLLAGENYYDGVEKEGEGRAVNRYNYSAEEVSADLQKPVVQRLLRLIRLRNTHPAFDGNFSIHAGDETTLILAWENGRDFCRMRLTHANYGVEVVCNEGTEIKTLLM